MSDLDDLLSQARRNTPMLLGVSGYPRSGKDAFAEVLVREYGFVKVAFADKLKQMAYAINPWVTDAGPDGEEPFRLQEIIDGEGWELAKDRYPEVRRFLKYLATEGVRDQDPDFWVRSAFTEVVKHSRVVMPDVRFQNEFWAISDANGVNVRIKRPSLEETDTHRSETELATAPFDYYRSNGGSLEEWQNEARELTSGVFERLLR